jgi:hypothetical protein
MLGPFTCGSPTGRFWQSYRERWLDKRTPAGSAVPRYGSGITWLLIHEALTTPDAVIEARISGSAKDGGSACATVPLRNGGWRIVRKSTTTTPE